MNHLMIVNAVLMVAAAVQAAFWQGNLRMAWIFLSYAVANALLAGAK